MKTKTNFINTAIFLILLSSLIINPDLIAQEVEPRLYQSLPTGLNAAAFSYSYSHGNIVADATAPVQDFILTSNIFVGGYLRTFSFFGRLAKVQALLPFVYMMGDLKYKGIDTSGSRTGLADARVRFIVNLLGQPALEPQEFQKFKEEAVLGASIVVAIPTGQFFEEKMVNIGSNRWSIKPEIGFSYRYESIYFEAYGGVWFFTENNSFLKTSTLEQDPLFTFQAHLCYYFSSGIWIAVNGAYANGGETKVNDIYKHDFQKNSRMGATLSVPFGKQHSVKVLFNTGAFTRVGGDFDMLTVAYQFVWF